MGFQYGARLSRLFPRSVTAATGTAAFLLSDMADNKKKRRFSKPQCEDAKENNKASSKLIFLGSGSSTGCPKPLCSLLFGMESSSLQGATETQRVQDMKKDLAKACTTSKLALDSPPVHNKNYRNNPSFLISLVDETTNERQNVVIDVGKTFREGALRWLPRLGIQSIDSIILTHEHMDAAGGLDDVRGVQPYVLVKQEDEDSNTSSDSGKPPNWQQVSMPLFLSQHCLTHLQSQFPWLLPKAKAKTETKPNKENTAPVIRRHVASFDVTVFEPFQPFEALPGFAVTPLPVMHGEDLVSYGFSFTLHDNCNVVYLSDISRMLPETLESIKSKPIHVLVVDALVLEGDHPVHYGLDDAIRLIRILQPQMTYLVGMNCDAFPPHDETNAMLAERYPDVPVQLAHDGLVIDVPITTTTTPSS